MPLIKFWTSNPSTVAEMSLEQIVNMAGDGKLLDGSEASLELRKYFSEIGTDKLGDYIVYCLTSSFNHSGYVLQDLINELGKRLEYEVEHGLYQGTKTAIGFDGIWKSKNGQSIIIEVKTTDAYRINLDTLAGYKNKLLGCQQIDGNASFLIVVGRKDTGDLEAQIRGSRYAWDIRIISSESLVKLVGLKEATGDDNVLKKIQTLLYPFEYTRLDNIIDIMFETAKEIEISSQEETMPEVKDDDQHDTEINQAQARTDSKEIESIRKRIINSYSKKIGYNLIKKNRAIYWNSNENIRVACTISKRYDKGWAYWYAFTKKWYDFLIDCKHGYYIVGFTDQNKAISLPFKFMNSVTENLYKTIGDKKHVWHIGIDCAGDDYLFQLRSGDPINVNEYVFELDS